MLHRIAIPLLATVFLASPVVAESMPFAGTWTTSTKNCQTARRTGRYANDTMRISAKGFRWHESSCRIVKTVPGRMAPPDVWHLRLSCSGEGETWTRDMVLVLRVKKVRRGWQYANRLVTVEPDGTAYRYVRCK